MLGSGGGDAAEDSAGWAPAAVEAMQLSAGQRSALAAAWQRHREAAEQRAAKRQELLGAIRSGFLVVSAARLPWAADPPACKPRALRPATAFARRPGPLRARLSPSPLSLPSKNKKRLALSGSARSAHPCLPLALAPSPPPARSTCSGPAPRTSSWASRWRGRGWAPWRHCGWWCGRSTCRRCRWPVGCARWAGTRGWVPCSPPAGLAAAARVTTHGRTVPAGPACGTGNLNPRTVPRFCARPAVLRALSPQSNAPHPTPNPRSPAPTAFLPLQVLTSLQQARLAAAAWPWYPDPAKWAPTLLEAAGSA